MPAIVITHNDYDHLLAYRLAVHEFFHFYRQKQIEPDFVTTNVDELLEVFLADGQHRHSAMGEIVFWLRDRIRDFEPKCPKGMSLLFWCVLRHINALIRRIILSSLNNLSTEFNSLLSLGALERRVPRLC